MPAPRHLDIEEELTDWLLDCLEAEGLDSSELDDATLDAWIAREVPDWRALVDQLARIGPSGKRSSPPAAVAPGALRTDPGRGGARAVVLHELKVGLRQLRRQPAFALASVLTLGLGVGVVAAVFTAVDAVAWKPIPVPAVDRLVNLYSHQPGGFAEHEPMAWPDMRDAAAAISSLEAVEGYAMSMAAIDDGRTRLGVAEMASDRFFEILGLRAAHGRLLGSADAGAPHAVLAHHLWQRDYGGDPGILGRTVRVNGTPFSLVGVAPPGFRGLFQGISPDVWIPLETGKRLGFGPMQSTGGPTPGTDLYDDRARRWLWSVARMSEGASLAALEAELEALEASLAADHPATHAERRFRAVPTSEVRLVPDLDGQLTTIGWLTLGVAGLV
ncbi:MAG: ABC transporter permease, partial [Holophagales bacterium]|nr:ABC transporter permease [Holophagales bacterium]